jgi:uncharacterized protein YsxB (DUF464 family)
VIKVKIYENGGNFRFEMRGHAKQDYVCGHLTGLCESLILLSMELARDYPGEVKVEFGK